MIIGITGKNASGRKTLAEYLVRKGFNHFSLSNEIREEAKRRNMTITFNNLIDLGNQMRARYGPTVWAERVKLKLDEGNDYVVTSFFNVEEVKVFKDLADFMLVSVIADSQMRFELIRSRAKEEDIDEFRSYEQFLENEKLEQSSDPNKQQLHKCHKMADIVIKNEGSIEEFYQKIDKLVTDLKKKYFKRPTWDEYFLGIVDAVAKRATCDRGRTAVLIVKDKRILATGYVGSPIGQPHCDDAGHLIKKLIHEDGKITQHCVRTNHAEVNAIALAARNGVAIDGATLYCKLEPCFTCAKMLVNAGIKRVVCQVRYHAAQDTRKLLNAAGVELTAISDKVEKYKGQSD